MSKPADFAYYHDPFQDKVSPDTAPRRLMVVALKTVEEPLSAHDLAVLAQISDQAARNFVQLLGKNYLTIREGRPNRYLWKTNAGKPATAAAPSPKGRGKIVLRWTERDSFGKRRQVRITLEGVPEDGSFTVKGIPRAIDQRIQK